MRHKKRRGKLSRPTSQRIALLRAQVSSLFLKEKIITTEAKAKEARRMAEKMITLAKKGGLHSRREVLRNLPDSKVVKNLFDNISPLFSERKSGYTRLTKVGKRRGDAAPLVMVELVRGS